MNNEKEIQVYIKNNCFDIRFTKDVKKYRPWSNLEINFIIKKTIILEEPFEIGDLNFIYNNVNNKFEKVIE